MNETTINQLPLKTDSDSIFADSIRWLAGMFAILDDWRLRQKSRAQFAGLDARILRDSGIGEAHRFIESNKPFWEA